MASLTWWTWVWASSVSWWWTGKPGLLQSMGSQRVGHDWATELNWTERLPLPSQPIVSLCSCSLPPLLSMITATLHRLLLQPRMSLPSPPYLSQCLTCGSEWVSEVAQSCPTLCDPMDTRLLRPWDFLGTSTGVGCHFLFQGIFPNQGSIPGLLHCRQTLYHLSHQGYVVRPPQIRDEWISPWSSQNPLPVGGRTHLPIFCTPEALRMCFS